MTQPLRRPSPSADPATALAQWAAQLRYEDIPAPVIAQAKRLLLDTLAVAWAGAGAEGITPVRTVIEAQQGRPESGVWVFGARLPATQATFLNGMLAAALDFDSVHDVATVHADAVVVPAVFALAEREGLSGREFLAAYVAGDELMVRLGLGIQSYPGWFYTSVLGVFAAAAASARALRLDAAGVQAAMGVALSRAAGVQQPLVERSLTKRLQSAFAARDGVEAALLAQAGVSAPADFLGGRAAFEALYTKLDSAVVLDGLGRDYRFPALTLKKYASCFCNHAAIEAVLELTGGRPMPAHEAGEVRVRITPAMARLVGGAFDPGTDPQVAAQFSVQYSVASALLRGRFSVNDIQPAAVNDPAVADLARRVKVELDDHETGRFTPATVTAAGRSVTSSSLPGTPGQPMSDEDVRLKASACLGSGPRPMGAAQAARLMDRIASLEDLPDLRGFWTGL